MNDESPFLKPSLSKPVFPKWLLLGLILGAIAVVMGGALFYRIQEQHLRKEVEQNLAAIVKLKVEAINDWREDLLQNASLLAENNILKAGIHAGTVDSGQVVQALNVCRIHGGFEEVLLVGNTGCVQVSASGKIRYGV